MSDLPDDLQSCHALIRRLETELAEARRKLAVHVENERREYEARYGKGVKPASLLAFGEMIERMSGRVDPKVIESELAAEDAMRARRKKK